MQISQDDVFTIKGLIFDPNLMPSFEAIKWCLCWADESATDIGLDGFNVIYELWIIRSLIHRGRELSASQNEYWNWALKIIPVWPGFRRMVLSDRDRQYFCEMMEDGGL